MAPRPDPRGWANAVSACVRPPGRRSRRSRDRRGLGSSAAGRPAPGGPDARRPRARPRHTGRRRGVPRRDPAQRRGSLQEPGVRRFDVLQDECDPTHVVLSEVYVDQAAADAHKQTPHYARWRDAVAGMMARAAAVDAVHRRCSPPRTAGDRRSTSRSPGRCCSARAARTELAGPAAHPRVAGAAVHGQRPAAHRAPAGRRRARRRRDGHRASRLVDDARAALAQARAAGADVVVAIGGGSVLDLARRSRCCSATAPTRWTTSRSSAAGCRSSGRPCRTSRCPPPRAPAPRRPRTRCCGSPEHGRKASIRSPHMLAAVALVDPLLTLGCPPAVTASSGLDALTQCLEPYVSPKANPATDAVAAEGLRRGARVAAPRLRGRRRPGRARGHGAVQPLRRDLAGQRQARGGARRRRRRRRDGRRPARRGLRGAARAGRRGERPRAARPRPGLARARPLRRRRPAAHRPRRRDGRRRRGLAARDRGGTRRPRRWARSGCSRRSTRRSPRSRRGRAACRATRWP